MTKQQTEAASRVPTVVAATMAFLFLAALGAAQAQTFTVLHSFSGADGNSPYSGITLDQQGRIYGTTYYGGTGNGVVYRLVHEDEGWISTPLYTFGSQNHDGIYPEARVVFGPDGVLYGTTSYGGAEGYGTVFSLRPPAAACKAAVCPWTETILYNFSGGADGAYPGFGDLVFDAAGNIYGTTYGGGGSSNGGVVFKLTRSGNSWTESVIWTFICNSGGCNPYGGVIFDNAGNLYGTASTVYELSPSQSGWTQTVLADSGGAGGGVIFDAHGNLFGITGGLDGGVSSAYEVARQSDGWSYAELQNFGDEYIGTVAVPTFDAHGNLYGPLPTIGDSFTGEIFQLTPSGNQWMYRAFYTFNGGASIPIGAVIFDADGNMYGTTAAGGTNDIGTVWEITP